MVDSKSTNQNASSAGGRSQNLRLAEDRFSNRRFFSRSPHLLSPRLFVTRPRPISARVQDGAGDRELRVFRVFFFREKNTINRLQAGYVLEINILSLFRLRSRQ